MRHPDALVIGVISDTHGLLRPQAVAALRGSHLILHAGDIGHPDLLKELRAIAPVIAVRGNVDVDPWTLELPQTADIAAGDLRICMIHNLKQLKVNPEEEGYAAVISGHTHQPRIERRGKVLYLNPGSAGPRRFRLPVTLARITLSQAVIDAALIDLTV